MKSGCGREAPRFPLAIAAELSSFLSPVLSLSLFFLRSVFLSLDVAVALSQELFQIDGQDVVKLGRDSE